jgi:hypothetical protein
LSKTITTLGFLIPASVVLTVDWFISKELDWSLYTLISLGAAWMWAIIPLMFPRLPYLIIGLATLVAVALEWGIGLVSGSIIWILKMGMPIVITRRRVGGLGDAHGPYSQRSRKQSGRVDTHCRGDSVHGHRYFHKFRHNRVMGPGVVHRCGLHPLTHCRSAALYSLSAV